MKKNIPILVSLVLLTACTSAPADSVAATPEPYRNACHNPGTHAVPDACADDGGVR